MVTRRLGPVLLLGVVALLSPAAAGAPSSSTADPAAKALARGWLPWYDAEADALKPVRAPHQYEPPDWAWLKWPIWAWLGRHLPDTGRIVLVLAIFFLIALACAVAWAVIRRLPGDEPPPSRPGAPGRMLARTGPLPAGLDAGPLDPWADALRLRAAGDYAAATVRLFAHQLLTLDRLGLARLAPGRTGRQLVRSVSLAAARDRVVPTLRLFEDVYYGHATPSAAAFEAAWARAEELEQLIAQGAVP